MARLSQSVKAQYTMLGEVPNDCYYCKAPSKLTDTTPNHRASEEDKAAFPDQWSITYVCSTCWNRINNANWTNEGRHFGVAKGCMTLAQKRALCGAKDVREAYVGAKFRLGFNGRLVIPTGIMQDGSRQDLFYLEDQAWELEELLKIQGPMALRAIGAPTGIVAECFWDIERSDHSGLLANPYKFTQLLDIPPIQE